MDKKRNHDLEEIMVSARIVLSGIFEIKNLSWWTFIEHAIKSNFFASLSVTTFSQNNTAVLFPRMKQINLAILNCFATIAPQIKMVHCATDSKIESGNP